MLKRLALGLIGVIAVGCAYNPERLPELDRRFYYNLETSEEQKEFLRLREEDRQGYLEQHGLWDKWIALPKEEREVAGDGRVSVGFHEFAVYMAWGPPADTKNKDSDGRAARIHTFIKCSSGPKVGRYVRNNLDCDGTSDETQIVISAGIVTEIRFPD